jgi:hypothetical protein
LPMCCAITRPSIDIDRKPKGQSPIKILLKNRAIDCARGVLPG